MTEQNSGAPRFIVFEGLDGAGKTTQIELLRAHLESLGQKVSVSAEPTDYESGRALRAALSGKVPKTPAEMAVMFTTDRIAHNQNQESGIEALLSRGYTVISDRYYYSSLAYQGPLTDYEWVKHMNLDCPEIRKPDLCIFLDLSPEESMRRITRNRAAEEREIYENLERLTEVREAFRRAFMKLTEEVSDEKRERIAWIDASGSIEEVAAAVRRAVE